MNKILKSTELATPLGPMTAISDEEALYLLEFTDQRALKRQIEKLETKATIVPGHTAIIASIETELKAYFAGDLKTFHTPFQIFGSVFQKKVWEELLRIPYGQTRSYADQARAIGKETAYRAVANANGRNQIAIVIPCHRIINSNGALGGYGGGLERKKWLLDHENHFPDFA